MKNVKMLDCTLRDGGYVNCWNFDTESALKVIEGLYDAGVQIIEIGIMGKNGVKGRQTLYSEFSDVEPLLVNRHADCEYALMMNVADIEQYYIPKRSEKTVDSIRIAFFKTEKEKALDYATMIKRKGYNVYLQTMASSMYSDCEFEELIDKVNRIKPYAFYMVDSFGTMMNQDVIEMEKLITNLLDVEIILGFHAHNNMQMAFSNVMAFLSVDSGHARIVDSSIYGMGRGAGNAPSELVMHYLNSIEKTYELIHLEEAYDSVIAPVFKEYYWGYSMNYMLTAVNNLNTAYGWYLGVKGIHSAVQFNRIVSQIDKENRFKLNKLLINELIEGCRDEDCN